MLRMHARCAAICMRAVTRLQLQIATAVNCALHRYAHVWLTGCASSAGMPAVREFAQLLRHLHASRDVRAAVQVYAQLLVERQLGVFAPLVLQLLSREPAERPSMHEFAAACEAIFEAPHSSREKDLGTTI
jgi:hypothetical protein